MAELIFAPAQPGPTVEVQRELLTRAATTLYAAQFGLNGTGVKNARAIIEEIKAALSAADDSTPGAAKEASQ